MSAVAVEPMAEAVQTITEMASAIAACSSLSCLQKAIPTGSGSITCPTEPITVRMASWFA